MKLALVVHMIFNALAKPKQYIVIQKVPQGRVPGARVIDIGGGGEGVIAQAGGARIIAVDKYESEIHEARAKAPDTPWMVADATELPYKNHSFENATAFFSCMYMPDDVKESVFRETRRVLKDGGEFWIWDAHMAPRGNVYAIRLGISLPDGHALNTIYGAKAQDQSAASICDMLQHAGFETEVITNQEHWFFIRARAMPSRSSSWY
jgi:ubiquinone/menaquinone biosynthesis C-methylase UbiE